MKNVNSPIGGRLQASVVDTINDRTRSKVPDALRSAVIEDVYTVDNPKATPYGAYTLYTIRIAPNGVVADNVPALGVGGHYNNEYNLPNYGPKNPNMQTPPRSVQNGEETPYVVGQPVVVGFLSGGRLNPIILGPAPTPYGNSKQTAANYPMKWGRHQGTEWWIDKTGNAEIDFPATANLTIKVNGSVLCTVKNGEVDLGGISGIEPTIMGAQFDNYIKNTVLNMLNSHTHAAGTLVAPSGGGTVTGITGSPSSTAGNPPSEVYTTVVKVK